MQIPNQLAFGVHSQEGNHISNHDTVRNRWDGHEELRIVLSSHLFVLSYPIQHPKVGVLLQHVLQSKCMRSPANKKRAHSRSLGNTAHGVNLKTSGSKVLSMHKF